MYAVVGATGNTGGAVVEALLSAGHQVRAIGRSAERLAPVVDRGAETLIGDISDPATAEAAFAGAGGVYSMIPPRFEVDLREWQAVVGESLAAGIRAAGVPYVVNLSSVGAQHHGGTGPIAGLREHEDRLNELTEVNVIHLRPGWFMENFLMSLNAIREMGFLALPIRGDVPIPMVATRDIGAEAARRLAALDFDGHHTHELLGPRAYTLNEAAAIIGNAIGRPGLGYAQVAYEVGEQALTEMGAAPATAATFVEMYRGFNEGRIRPEEERSPSNTTPTTLADFGPVLAAAYGT